MVGVTGVLGLAGLLAVSVAVWAVVGFPAVTFVAATFVKSEELKPLVLAFTLLSCPP